jgi:hypothetical protein
MSSFLESVKPWLKIALVLIVPTVTVYGCTACIYFLQTTMQNKRVITRASVELNHSESNKLFVRSTVEPEFRKLTEKLNSNTSEINKLRKEMDEKKIHS